MSKGLELDFETADRITLLTLQDQYKYLKEELRAHLEHGHHMHPDDMDNSMKMIYALELIINYFGGSV